MSVFMICERALALIRGKRLSDLNDSQLAMLEALNYQGLVSSYAQEEAVTCVRHFTAVRDSLLQVYPWVFARKSAVLAELTEPLRGWRYACALPSDCLRLIDLTWRDRRIASYEQVGLVVGCEYSPVTARYTARMEDTDDWPPLFQDAFCARLASEMPPAVIGNFDVISLATQQFQFAVQAGYRTGIIDECAGLELDLYPYDGYSNDFSTEYLGSGYSGDFE